MTPPRARPVLLALLGIVAIAVAAATLNSAVAVDGEFGLGSGDGFGPGNGSGPDITPATPAPTPGALGPSWALTICVPLVTDPLFQLGAGGVALLAGYLLYRRIGALLTIGLAVGFAPPVVVLYLVMSRCAPAQLPADQEPVTGAANQSRPFDLFAGNGTGGGGGGVVSSPSLILLGLLGVALIAAVALLFVTSDEQTIGDDAVEEESSESQATPAAIGRAAGRAADRIEEDADLANEVYRAWHEMTTYLDVPNPESSSPGEFADAAVAAGMDRDDVGRLTRLFEEVRYGAADPTEERERDAIDALRRIENEYAEDDA